MNKYLASVLAATLVFNSTTPKFDEHTLLATSGLSPVNVAKFYLPYEKEAKKAGKKFITGLLKAGVAVGSTWAVLSYITGKIFTTNPLEPAAVESLSSRNQAANNSACPVTNMTHTVIYPKFNTFYNMTNQLNHGARLALASGAILGTSYLAKLFNDEQKQQVAQQVLAYFLNNWKNIKPAFAEMPEAFLAELDKMSNSYKRNPEVLNKDAQKIVNTLMYIVRHSPNRVNDAYKKDFLDKNPETTSLQDVFKKVLNK